MPIQLPPISRARIDRRRFLGKTAAGAAALLLGPCGRTAGAAAGSPAKDAARQAPVWALLSDTHIHESVADENQGNNMAANLLRVAAEVLEARPGAALVNGDLAKVEGKPGDYATFLKLVEPLRAAGVPIHATLGNHDHRESFERVLGARGEKLTEIARAGVTGKYCEALERDGVRWLLLDSLDETNKVPGLAGAAQIDWVARELDQAPEAPAILFIHHNVEPSSIGLTDREALMTVLRPRLQVKAVFFGHTHVWRRFVDDGIHMVNLPAIGYAFAQGEPLGWVRSAPRPDGLTIELRALGAAHRDHGKRIDLPWRTRRDGVRAF